MREPENRRNGRNDSARIECTGRCLRRVGQGLSKRGGAEKQNANKTLLVANGSGPVVSVYPTFHAVIFKSAMEILKWKV